MEPYALRRGKEFHRRVQADWAGEIEGAAVRSEHGIPLGPVSDMVKHHRRGRIDIFISRIADFVSVVELKSTDWDQVLPQNRRRLLGAHCRQVLKYVDKYLDQDQVSVCAGLVYPHSPGTAGLKAFVEQYLGSHGLQVAWYDDDLERSDRDGAERTPPWAPVV